jgi:hypothetical protein
MSEILGKPFSARQIHGIATIQIKLTVATNRPKDVTISSVHSHRDARARDDAPRRTANDDLLTTVTQNMRGDRPTRHFHGRHHPWNRPVTGDFIGPPNSETLVWHGQRSRAIDMIS